MRVMLVGDSMTVGSVGDFTWRYRIWQHLNATYGGPWRLVGPRETLYDPATDTSDSPAYGDTTFPSRARRHLAGWGEGWCHMAPLIQQETREHRADTLLVFLGLIDLGFYTGAQETSEQALFFLREARVANPGIQAVLMPVIPNIRAQHDEWFAAEVHHFNELLGKLVAELSTEASPLLLASPPHDWDLNRDTYDGTHPSAQGEHRIAASFANAMYQAWGLGGPYQAGPGTRLG
ncbi:GDSL-type esterase/lipase family protein [Streptomyces sp. NPDC005438]|uniref:GDSL-type esterase/lipase family protein n=1 Tax=Streptomyces sp. NPDC005438 TaxID=3156880 RepID=UPI0033A580C7